MIRLQSFVRSWLGQAWRIVILYAGMGAVMLSQAEESPKVPVTHRVDHVDTYHGVEVADPYRWLETDLRQSPEVEAWIEQQNAVTFAYLRALPDRTTFHERLTKLWNYERYSAPFKAGGKYYFFRNDGLQNQAVLFQQTSLHAPPTVLIDPNTWSPDGSIALGGQQLSDDGQYIAYGIQEAGSDWETWRIRNIVTGELLPEELKWIKFSEPEWTPDSKGFFYSRFPEPQAGAEFQNLNLNQQIYYHRVGTPQSEDVLTFRTPEHPEWGFASTVTEDGRYHIITIWIGTDDRYRVAVRDLAQPEVPARMLIDHFDHEYSFLGNDGPLFYFKTNFEAPRKRVVAISLDEPHRVVEVVPQQRETMTQVSLVGSQFLVQMLSDAQSRVAVYGRDGTWLRDVALPGIGSASGFGGKQSDLETFYSFSSFTTPPEAWRYDLLTGESQRLRQAKVDFQPDRYRVEQVFYASKDGTRVPMFIISRNDVVRDGHNPTLLYGYGGFNIPLTPSFSVARLAWLERGGIFAVANLRGGGEYGEEWHQAGVKQRKQNVFDDFIAAAEHLVAEKWTSPAHLGIQGGSNGGLLVGACLTQRPELFGACFPAVGVMDMLRFHQFTAGRYWVDDYGSADDPDEFRALYAYSPYHNLKPNSSYPATLVTTADTDDRVVPGHSFKFAAALQAAQSGPAPTLIRIESRAGHGDGKPTTKLIEETADVWAFAWKHLSVRD